MSTTRPTPSRNPVTEPFWAALGRRKLVVQECEACGRAQYYPRLLCRHCQSRALRWIETEPRGTIYSFSVVHRAPGGFAAELPFVTAVIELAAGPRLFARLVGVAPDSVAIGMRVEAAWASDPAGAVTLDFKAEEPCNA